LKKKKSVGFLTPPDAERSPAKPKTGALTERKPHEIGSKRASQLSRNEQEKAMLKVQNIETL
jgi:hypothetical protein